MSRRDREQESLQISRFEHAPPDSRPFGIDLTETSSQCGCRDQKDVWTSCQISQALELKEDLCFLTSGCGSTELFVALYAGVRRTFDLHGATIMEELWDSQMRRFAFSEADMMVMKVWRRKDGPDKRPIHDKPWTEAGKRNLKS
ncbi:hypothetical protein FRC09_019817 [Ceratobasidium sp. 395]|nr:hypothetical protein FRC09_019817 [Ceratobasidium sp. 395]